MGCAACGGLLKEAKPAARAPPALDFSAWAAACKKVEPVATCCVCGGVGCEACGGATLAAPKTMRAAGPAFPKHSFVARDGRWARAE